MVGHIWNDCAHRARTTSGEHCEHRRAISSLLEKDTYTHTHASSSSATRLAYQLPIYYAHSLNAVLKFLKISKINKQTQRAFSSKPSNAVLKQKWKYRVILTCQSTRRQNIGFNSTIHQFNTHRHSPMVVCYFRGSTASSSPGSHTQWRRKGVNIRVWAVVYSYNTKLINFHCTLESICVCVYGYDICCLHVLKFTPFHWINKALLFHMANGRLSFGLIIFGSL